MSAKLFRIILIVALLALAALPVFCQSPAPSYISVARYQVKMDRATECRDLMKQIAEFYKKAAPADQYSIVYSSTVGNAFEYWVYSPMNKFADRDGASPLTKITKPEERAALYPRFLQYMEHVQGSIMRPINDLSVIASGAKFPPTFINAFRISVRPGKENDFISIAKADLVPAIKKINGSVFLVQQTVAGGNPSVFLAYTGFEKWAELDDTATFLNAMGGEQAVQKFGEKMSQVAAVSEHFMLRYEPDLSYIPAAPAQK